MLGLEEENKMRVVIIGGVAGGMSCATRLRRLNEDAEIIILEKGPYVSFANCGLPYYIGDEIKDREQLLVQTPEKLHKRFNLDVRTHNEAIKIDSKQKVITVHHLETNEQYELTYDNLVLSPGAKPFIPPINGLSDADNVFMVRTVADVDAITDYLRSHPVKKAVVIGAGFIGLEMAENLANRGLDVTIVEKAPHVLPPLDVEMAKHVENKLVNNRVNVLVNVSAKAFLNKGKIIKLDNDQTIESDLTILSVGVVPTTDLAKTAGVKTGIRGGILVDEFYQTNIPHIYAVGDAIVVKHNITNEDAMIALASPANRQGRQVADVIAGISRKNKGSLGTAIVRVFDLVAASTGLSERQAQQAGLIYDAVHVLSTNHATYYPGAKPILLKMLFNPTSGDIYGAQAVGQAGVDKRIDVLATAIKAGLKVDDLIELEFTYAPPFGSAKDPVNLVGYAALNIMEGLSEIIQYHELDNYLSKGYQLLDVRTQDELKAGKLKDAIHMPLEEIRNQLNQLDQTEPYIVSCVSGQRSYLAERILKQAGFNVKNLSGSFYLYSLMYPDKITK